MWSTQEAKALFGRQFPWWAAKLGVAAILIWYLFHTDRLSLRFLDGLLDRKGLLLAACAASLILAAQVVMAVRLKLLLQARFGRSSWWLCLKVTLVGLFFNNFLPTAMGGDLVKGYYLVNGRRQMISPVAATLVLDRLVGFTGLAVLALAGLGLLESGAFGLKLPPALVWGIGALGVAFVVLLAIILLSNGSRVKGWLEKRSPRGRLQRMFWGFLSDLSLASQERRTVLACLAISLAPHLLAVFGLHLVSLAIGGQAGWGVSLTLGPQIYLTGILPLAPNNLGWTEYFGSVVWSAQRLHFGGDLWLAYRLVGVVASLSGVVFYLTTGRRQNQG